MNSPRVLAELVRGGPPVATGLSKVQADLVALERRLRALNGPQSLAVMCSELFGAGGKRLRAAAAVVVARAWGLGDEETVKIAEVVELTHGATLLHDDVIDEADLRRGRPAARVRWSNTMSVLGGDSLLVRALSVVAALDCPALLDAHLRTLDALVAAEAAQHLASQRLDLSEAGYLEIARGKTGTLFGFACGAPALLVGDRSAALALERFGLDVGVAFQVADDLRDVLAQDPSKSMYLDFRDGVLTLPIRLAALELEQVRHMLERTRHELPSPREIDRFVCLVRKTAAIGRSVEMARQHLQEGRTALETVPHSDRLDLLRDVCGWLDDELNRFAKEGTCRA